MKVEETEIKGCFVITPNVIGDQRGYFFEAFNERNFNELTGLDVHFVQDNQSMSSYGVLRGLHGQAGKHAQAKLVRVLQGEVLDIAVDLREGSETYGKYTAVTLSAENKKQLFVPRGFLHGFIVLSETAEFFYKCDNFYNKEAEIGVRYDDPTIGINWMLKEKDFIISEKDKGLSFLEK